MRRLLIVVPLAAVVAGSLIPGAGAEGCGETTAVAARIYIDDRRGDELPSVPPSALPDDVWIYVETNGVEGLQAGGTSPAFGYTDEACANDTPGAEPDTLIF